MAAQQYCLRINSERHIRYTNSMFAKIRCNTKSYEQRNYINTSRYRPKACVVTTSTTKMSYPLPPSTTKHYHGTHSTSIGPTCHVWSVTTSCTLMWTPTFINDQHVTTTTTKHCQSTLFLAIRILHVLNSIEHILQA